MITRKRGVWHGPLPQYPIETYKDHLNGRIVEWVLKTGNRPRGIRLQWRNWIYIWNQPRLKKEWGIVRNRSRGTLRFRWQGRLLVLYTRNAPPWGVEQWTRVRSSGLRK